MAEKTKLEEGKRYRVRFRLAEDHSDKEMVGTYVGDTGSGEHGFDLKPSAGAIALSPDSVKSAKEVDEDEKHSKPKRA